MTNKNQDNNPLKDLKNEDRLPRECHKYPKNRVKSQIPRHLRPCTVQTKKTSVTYSKVSVTVTKTNHHKLFAKMNYHKDNQENENRELVV